MHAGTLTNHRGLAHEPLHCGCENFRLTTGERRGDTIHLSRDFCHFSFCRVGGMKFRVHGRSKCSLATKVGFGLCCDVGGDTSHRGVVSWKKIASSTDGCSVCALVGVAQLTGYRHAVSGHRNGAKISPLPIIRRIPEPDPRQPRIPGEVQ
ncbi:hypothetical protein N657DRAFT_484724 [Parathielavia appendiculata]|uniref:Uncharacterized protein n=1 Tax=Parathielavia appendiculata TaxID=2587402 RepID=A0AAN6U051_9PEZI|nr:hypothetical protein N657DRAFT_484724 [Parathielavia appendiculata]